MHLSPGFQPGRLGDVPRTHSASPSSFCRGPTRPLGPPASQRTEHGQRRGCPRTRPLRAGGAEMAEALVPGTLCLGGSAEIGTPPDLFPPNKWPMSKRSLVSCPRNMADHSPGSAFLRLSRPYWPTTRSLGLAGRLSGESSTKTDCGRGSTRPGFSLATLDFANAPAQCWICTSVVGKGNRWASANSSFRPTRRQVFKPGDESIQPNRPSQDES